MDRDSARRGRAWRHDLRVLVPVFAFLGLAIFGLFTDFVPAEPLTGRSGPILVFSAGAALTLAVLGFGASRGTLRIDGPKAWLGVAALPLMLALGSWLAVKGVGSLASQAFGEPYRWETRMRSEYVHSRRSCDHRLTGPAVAGSFPHFLCLDPAVYRRYPDQPLRVVLHGRRSWIGHHVARIEVLGPD